MHRITVNEALETAVIMISLADITANEIKVDRYAVLNTVRQGIASAIRFLLYESSTGITSTTNLTSDTFAIKNK